MEQDKDKNTTTKNNVLDDQGTVNSPAENKDEPHNNSKKNNTSESNDTNSLDQNIKSNDENEKPPKQEKIKEEEATTSKTENKKTKGSESKNEKKNNFEKNDTYEKATNEDSSNEEDMSHQDPEKNDDPHLKTEEEIIDKHSHSNKKTFWGNVKNSVESIHGDANFYNFKSKEFEKKSYVMEQIPYFETQKAIEKELKKHLKILIKQRVIIIIKSHDNKAIISSALYGLLEALSKLNWKLRFTEQHISISDFSNINESFDYFEDTVTHVDATECNTSELKLLLKPEILINAKNKLAEKNHCLIYVVNQSSYKKEKNSAIPFNDEKFIWHPRDTVNNLTEYTQNKQEDIIQFNKLNPIQIAVLFTATFLPGLSIAEFNLVIETILKSLINTREFNTSKKEKKKGKGNNLLEEWNQNKDTHLISAEVFFKAISYNHSGFLMISSAKERETKKYFISKMPNYIFQQLNLIEHIFIFQKRCSNQFTLGFANLLTTLNKKNFVQLEYDYIDRLFVKLKIFGEFTGLDKLTVLLKNLLLHDGLKSIVFDFFSYKIKEYQKQKHLWQQYLKGSSISYFIDNLLPPNMAMLLKQANDDNNLEQYINLSDQIHSINYFFEEVFLYRNKGIDYLIDLIHVSSDSEKFLLSKYEEPWISPNKSISLWRYQIFLKYSKFDISILIYLLEIHETQAYKYQDDIKLLIAVYLIELSNKLIKSINNNSHGKKNQTELYQPFELKEKTIAVASAWILISTNDNNKIFDESFIEIAEFYSLLAMGIGCYTCGVIEKLDNYIPAYANILVNILPVRSIRKVYNFIKINYKNKKNEFIKEKRHNKDALRSFQYYKAISLYHLMQSIKLATQTKGNNNDK